MIDENLKAYVSGLGTAAGNRVHIGNAFQDTVLPVVVIRRVSGNTPRTLGGQKLRSRAQYAINIVGLDYASVMPVANAVRLGLDGFIGSMGTTRVHSARCLSEPADFSEIDGDVTLRVIGQEFSFVYSEA